MGVLAPGSVHARPSARPPIDTSVTFKHLPQPLRSHIRSFGTLGKYLKLPPLTPQIYDSSGGRGAHRIFCLVGILLFLLVRSPYKISEPYDNF